MSEPENLAGVGANRDSNCSGGETMKNPLDSLWGTIIAGVILTAILYYVVKNVLL
jgi:hypothetical protein